MRSMDWDNIPSMTPEELEMKEQELIDEHGGYGGYENWIRGLNDPNLFVDEKHPLAHNDEGWLWEESHKSIVNTIKSRMKERGISTKELAEKLPDASGTKLGITTRRTNGIISNPETASVRQVNRLCMVLQCSLDYLRCTVSEAEQRKGWGSPDEMAELYRLLTPSSRHILWEVAEGLLCREDEFQFDVFRDSFWSRRANDH